MLSFGDSQRWHTSGTLTSTRPGNRPDVRPPAGKIQSEALRASVTSAEAYTGTCVAAMLAAFSRTTSPSDEGVGVTNDRCHSRYEARLPLRCRYTYVTLGP